MPTKQSASKKEAGAKADPASLFRQKEGHRKEWGESTSRGGRGTQSPSLTAEAIRQKNQIRAVVLFACAILLGCLALIPGDNLWRWVHNAILRAVWQLGCCGPC